MKSGFQPMPKRFKIWDKKSQSFAEEKINDMVLDLAQLASFMMLEVGFGHRYADFEFVQSTNFFDKDGKEILEGSILESTQNKVGFVKLLADEGRYAIYYPDYGWTALDILSAGDNKSIGHILSNPELLEERRNV